MPEDFSQDLLGAWGDLVNLADEMDAETGYQSLDVKIKMFSLAVQLEKIVQLKRIADVLEKGKVCVIPG
jgi:hypothetical protein